MVKIEKGKAYKHPQIAEPYVALDKTERNGREVWSMLKLSAMIKFSMDGKDIPFTDYWLIGEDYANNSGMYEVPMEDYELNEDGELIKKVA